MSESKLVPVDDKVLQQLQEYVTRRVAEGFAASEEIAESAVEYLYECDPEELRPYVGPVVAKLLEDHRLAQETWPAVTDCDKLDAAFAELESNGILARQDYLCCGTCAHAGLYAEMQQAPPDSSVRGYVFYHGQDTEGAIYGSIYLGYGSMECTEETMVGVANTVVETLRDHGITCEWNGQTNARILVKDFDWKRRRVFDTARR
jgi:hypothetical protein